MTFSNQGNKTPYCPRGGRYYRKKLSTADISEFFKLSANYRYRILGIWELSKNYRYQKLHPILSDKHNCSKNKKGTTMINRKAACCQRLLVQQSQHRDSAMVLDIKSVVRSTTREHVKLKYVVASPLKRILWNKDSDS